MHENRHLQTVIVKIVMDKCHGECEEKCTMYMYSRMCMKIEYLPAVVVQVVMDKVSWGM